MNYYRMYVSSDTKVIGRKFPQIETYDLPIAWTDPLCIESFLMKHAPEEAVFPNNIKLWKSAKLTDVISSSGVGFTLSLIISEKLYNIIKALSHYGMQFFSVSVIDKNGISNKYWLLHPYASYFDAINLPGTVMGYYNQGRMSEPIRMLQFSNHDDFANEVETYYSSPKTDANFQEMLVISKLDIGNQLKKDFFVLQPVYGRLGYYVSERLKSQIEAAGCTGMVFTGPDERYP